MSRLALTVVLLSLLLLWRPPAAHGREFTLPPGAGDLVGQEDYLTGAKADTLADVARRDRRQGGVTAPPDGLYLVQVEYPARYRLPAFPPESGLW